MSLVEVAKYLEPESALAWAGTISDAEARIGQISTVWWTWSSVNEEAARGAVTALPLNEAEKEKLREQGLDFLK